MTLARQVGEVLTKMAELHVTATALTRRRDRGVEQRARRLIIVREHAAVVQKWQRDQRAAEQPAVQEDRG